MSAPGLRWSLTRLNTASTTVVAFTLAADAQVGDTLVAKVTARDGAASITAPDGTWLGPLPATPPRTAATSGGVIEWVWVKRVTATIPAGTVISFASATSRSRAGILSCWTGLANLPGTAAEIVAAGQANPSSVSMPYPAITPYHTSGLLLTLGGSSNGALSVTPDASTTEFGDGVTAIGATDVLTFGAYKTMSGLAAVPIAQPVATMGAAAVSAAVTLFLPDTDASPINRPPVARAGADQWATSETVVTLNGAGSTDPDSGTTLTYSWTQTAGPQVALSSSAVASPTFSAPRDNVALTFQLTVSDGTLTSTDTVAIVVKHPPFGLIRRPGGSVPVFD